MKTKKKIVVSFLDRKTPATITEISKRIRADYRITHTAVQLLLADNVLCMTKVGNSSLCTLNRRYTGVEIVTAEQERRSRVMRNQNIKKLWEDIAYRVGSSHFTLLLHGAYAQEEANKFSDINLLFISNEQDFSKKVAAALFDIPLRVHTTVLTEEQFVSLAHEADSPIAQAVQHNIILHGIESFYLLQRRLRGPINQLFP
jgi:DNA-binding transcriptional ArsR family regulator